MAVADHQRTLIMLMITFMLMSRSSWTGPSQRVSSACAKPSVIQFPKHQTPLAAPSSKPSTLMSEMKWVGTLIQEV